MWLKRMRLRIALGVTLVFTVAVIVLNLMELHRPCTMEGPSWNAILSQGSEPIEPERLIEQAALHCPPCQLEHDGEPHPVTESAMKQDILTTGPLDQYKVPNIVHFVWYTPVAKPLQFHQMLSIYSAYRTLKPGVIYFHTNVPPYGDYWNKVKDLPTFKINLRRPPTELFGEKIKDPVFYTSHSNVDRLKILHEYGGIYLDLDVLVTKSFDPLRMYDCTVGLESSEQVCNSVIVCSKDSPYLLLWLNSFLDDYRVEEWSYNSGKVPYLLSQRYPQLVHVEATSINRPNYKELHKIWGPLSFEWKDNYAVHLWYRVWKTMSPYYKEEPNEKNVLDLGNTFSRIAYDILYGRDGMLDTDKTLTDSEETAGERFREQLMNAEMGKQDTSQLLNEIMGDSFPKVDNETESMTEGKLVTQEEETALKQEEKGTGESENRKEVVNIEPNIDEDKLAGATTLENTDENEAPMNQYPNSRQYKLTQNTGIPLGFLRDELIPALNRQHNTVKANENVNDSYKSEQISNNDPNDDQQNLQNVVDPNEPMNVILNKNDDVNNIMVDKNNEDEDRQYVIPLPNVENDIPEKLASTKTSSSPIEYKNPDVVQKMIDTYLNPQKPLPVGSQNIEGANAEKNMDLHQNIVNQPNNLQAGVVHIKLQQQPSYQLQPQQLPVQFQPQQQSSEQLQPQQQSSDQLQPQQQLSDQLQPQQQPSDQLQPQQQPSDQLQPQQQPSDQFQPQQQLSDQLHPQQQLSNQLQPQQQLSDQLQPQQQPSDQLQPQQQLSNQLQPQKQLSDQLQPQQQQPFDQIQPLAQLSQTQSYSQSNAVAPNLDIKDSRIQMPDKINENEPGKRPPQLYVESKLHQYTSRPYPDEYPQPPPQLPARIFKVAPQRPAVTPVPQANELKLEGDIDINSFQKHLQAEKQRKEHLLNVMYQASVMNDKSFNTVLTGKGSDAFTNFGFGKSENTRQGGITNVDFGSPKRVRNLGYQLKNKVVERRDLGSNREHVVSQEDQINKEAIGGLDHGHY